MALIDLKTNFRSLKFGLGQASDKPGGGYSNQPYIVKPIPDYNEDASNIFNTGGPDSLLRGGLMAPLKAIDDVSRLTQMFFDLKSPNGLLFTAKQNVLSRNSVKTEASKGLGTAGGTVNQGLYLPTSTILQAGVGFTGTHLNLLGLNPFSPGLDNDSYQSQRTTGGLMKYETVAKYNNEANRNQFYEVGSTPGILNPLYELFNTQPLILGSEASVGTNPYPKYDSLPTQTSIEGKFENRLLDIWYNKQLKKNDDTIILDYGGGPGSVLGIGKTKIPFASGQRTGENNPLAVSNPTFFYGLPGRENQTLKDTYKTEDNLKLYRATQLAAKSSLLNLSELTDTLDPNGDAGYKVIRNSNDSDVLLRKPSEIDDSKLGNKLALDTTSDYLPNPYFTNLQEFQTHFPTSSFINDGNDKDILEKGGISPYVLNNNLITNVSTMDGLGQWYIHEKPIPNIYDSLNKYTKKNSATELYKSLTKDVNGASGMNESMDFSLYSFGANGFSVYDPAIEGNTWPTITNLQSGGQVTNHSRTWNQDMLISQKTNEGKFSGAPSIQDFRAPLIGTQASPTVASSTIMSLAPDYTDPNVIIDNRVGVGNPGSSRNVLKYNIDEPGMDRINAREFYTRTSPIHSTHSKPETFGNDLCKFTIGLLNNDGSGNSNFIQFRAYIDDFSDTYGADWGEVQYVGRGDKFYNYKGFNRSISMGWTVHASSRGELIPMYKKLNYLASGLAPDYSSGGFMRGNLARLTVGGYLYNQLGIIKSITYTIPSESPWEIGIEGDAGFDNDVKELPHMIKVTGFEFIPIQYDVAQKGLTKFIQLQAIKGTNWSRGMQMPSNGVAPKAKAKQIEEEGKKEKTKKPIDNTPVTAAVKFEDFKQTDYTQFNGNTVADNTKVVSPIIMPNNINNNINGISK